MEEKMQQFAVAMVAPYARRGDSYEHVKNSYLGHASNSFYASISGYVGNKHYGGDYIVCKYKEKVTVYKLKDIWDMALKKQLTLF